LITRKEVDPSGTHHDPNLGRSRHQQGSSQVKILPFEKQIAVIAALTEGSASVRSND
jgi:hypothetical protein